MEGKTALLYCFMLILTTVSSLTEKNGKSPRIVGDIQVENAELAKYKYMGDITNMAGQVRCGGFIASPLHVITSAHCAAKELSKTDIKVRVAGTVKSSSIIKVDWHPDYNPVTRANDIAVLKLDAPLTVPMYLGTKPLRGESVPDWTDCILTGYGASVAGGTETMYLRYRPVVVVPSKNCSDSILSGQICTAPAALCTYDGGDPLVCNGELVGIGVSDSNCGSKDTDVFVDISSYKSWLDDIMNSAPTTSINPLALLGVGLVILKTRC